MRVNRQKQYRMMIQFRVHVRLLFVVMTAVWVNERASDRQMMLVIFEASFSKKNCKA